MSLKDCYNFEDFRKLAKKKLPSPIFHYIDGGSDDESTLRRNTDSFNDCDLVPNVLASVGKPDLSTTLFGRKIDMPIFLSPAAMQRLYHPDGDRASARAAEKFNTFYSMSSMGNNTIEEVANISGGPKLFQLYVHKDRSISDDLIDRSRRSGFDAMCLTVDTLVAGNREKDHRTGFTTPPKLTLESLMSFAMRPQWVFNYLTGKKFELANVKKKTDKGTNIAKSVIEYINEQYDPAMGWKDAEYCAKKWNGPFALKGVMSVEDAKRAIDIGCTAIMISNHGGRQLDGSRSPFDQIKAISDAVGDKLEIILDGGVRRGTHVLKAIAAGAKACSFGKMFLFSLAAGGQKGVEHLLQNMHDEINKLYNQDIDPERIIIMPGGKPTMSYAIQCFGEPGVEIIHPTPAFPIYESMINFTGAKPVPYDLTEDKDLKFNPEKILSLITDKTKLLVLINPNNPTGSFVDKSDIDVLDGPDDSINEMMRKFTIRRKLIHEGLNNLPGVECSLPGGAFYAFPKVIGTGMNGAEFAKKCMHEAGVAIVPGTAFGKTAQDYVRFSFAASSDNISQALEKIKKMLG